MTGEMIFRPRLHKEKRVVDEKSAKARSVIGKKNIGRFFTHLYSEIFDGRVNGPGFYSNDSFGDISVYFKPDVVFRKKGNLGFSEIKACSLKSGAPICTEHQLEIYTYFLLKDYFKSKVKINYCIFNYGNSCNSTQGIHMLSNGRIVEELSFQKKDLNIFPIELMFLFKSCSNNYSLNQATSFGPDNVDYFKPKRSLVNKLNNEGVELIINENTDSFFPNDFESDFLSTLKRRDFKSPGIIIDYHGRAELKKFPIVKHYFKDKDYKKWMKYFFENHEDVLMRLKLRDFYQQREDYLSEVPF